MNINENIGHMHLIDKSGGFLTSCDHHVILQAPVQQEQIRHC